MAGVTDGAQRTISLLHSLSQVFRWHKQRKNRLEPLRQWICDHCQQLIKRPEDGWVEWLSEPDGSRCRGFRLVHHEVSSPLRPDGSCDRYSDHPERNPVRPVIDEASLMDFIGSPHYLLSLASPGPYVERHYSGPRIADLDEWAELARRITIPYYEEARHYLPRAAAAGAFRDYYDPDIYSPHNLLRIIETYGREAVR
jgi:hypothetical protein